MKSYINFIKESTISQIDYVKILQDIIKKDNKSINGFKFNFDPMSETFEWYNKEYVILATPYWDNNKALPIDITTKNGDNINDRSIDMPELKNIRNVNSVIKFYYKKIDEITSYLNKRSELIKYLKLILKYSEIKIDTSINGVYIRNIYSTGQVDAINQTDMNKLTSKEIDIILDIINKKYSYIISADKYNM